MTATAPACLCGDNVFADALVEFTRRHADQHERDFHADGG